MHRSLSPPLSTSSTLAPRSAPRNIVMNLAIDGHARAGDDGVCIKMFLKIALSGEHISHPLIPLFPEENSIRIVNYAVHPVNSSWAPYAGGPKHNNLLKAASRALKLPPETTKSYLDAFVTTPGLHNGRGASRQPTQISSPPPLDVTYTGTIQVSNYAVCFVLPKQWPQRIGTESESDDLLLRSSTPSSGIRSRRASVGGDRKSFRFMAAIEVWVPYLGVPPNSPYLLSIPVPRCLGNTLKLRIFCPPGSQTPEQDPPRWDLMTDPIVQYKNSGMQSSSGLGHTADDESFSDTSETNVNANGGVVLVQGAFQSTDRLRIRWAKPLNDHIPMDGLRRASCKKVESQLKIRVLEVLDSPMGFRLGIDYSALCSGVQHPSVASRLALDISLDAKGQRISWAEASRGWSIRGGAGYLGFDPDGTVPSEPKTISRRTSASSFDSPSVLGSPAALDDPASRMRVSSIPIPAGSASLLKIPLTLDGIADYSFEATPHMPARTASLASSSGLSSATDISNTTTSISDNENEVVPLSGRLSEPSNRVTLHVDLDSMLSNSRQDGNQFEYSIAGVLDLRIETLQMDNAGMDALISLPVFRMIGAKEERIQMTVITSVPNVVLHSDSGTMSHHGYQPSHSTGRDLLVGVPVSCAEDGQLSTKPILGRIHPSLPNSDAATALADSISPEAQSVDAYGSEGRTSIQLRMPKLGLSTQSTDEDDMGRFVSSSVSSTYDLITRVHVVVEPIPSSTKRLQTHMVRVRVPVANTNVSCLDFSLRPRVAIQDEKMPEVELVYAAIGGRPVQADVLTGRRSEFGALALPEAADSTWVRLFLGDINGASGDLDIVYTVAHNAGDQLNGPRCIIPDNVVSCVAVLPTFYCRIGLLQVDVRCPRGYCIGTVHSNLSNQVIESPSLVSLTGYSLPVSFAPQTSISIIDNSRKSGSMLAQLFKTVPLLLAVLALILLFMQHSQIQDLHIRLANLQSKPPICDNGWSMQSVHVSNLSTDLPTVTQETETTSSKADPVEQLDRTHLSLSLRRLPLRDLVSIVSPKHALSVLMQYAWRLSQRFLYFPLRPDK